MIRLFKHYIPYAVLLIGAIDLIMLIGGAELAGALRLWQIEAGLEPFSERLPELLVFAATRYASVASMVAALALPLIALLFGEPWPVVVFSVGASIAVLLLHRANLARLRAGTETRVQLRRRPAPSRS